jgi:branched-chain amino acid transport system ATP-binding protein
MLEVENLHSGYGSVPILGGVSFNVRAGEFVGVLGHNGMGKTTLMRALIGTIAATRGRILLGGNDVTGLPAHRRARQGLAYVPQGRDIFPGLSVRENLQLAAIATRVPAGERMPAVLAQFPRLGSLINRPGGALSGGEQQLLALARALIPAPRVILLDEPTEGIQPSIIEEISERLLTYREARQLTLVLVEQNLDFIRDLADRVLLIHKGRITADMPIERLDAPEIIDEFIGATPR